MPHTAAPTPAAAVRPPRPWTRLKVAASLDGRTALENGASQWITSPAARADGHAWRAQADAVLTGIGTVLHDDPLLDVRLAPAGMRLPALAVVDSALRTPDAARLFDVAGRALVFYAAAPDLARQAALEARGARVARLPAAGGRVDLAAVLADLAARGVQTLHVEAGELLNGALLAQGLVDELLFYIAPKLIGPGRGIALQRKLDNLLQAIPLEFTDVATVGPDLRVLARVLAQPAA